MTDSSKNAQTFSAAELSRIIEMAWEDRTPVRSDRGSVQFAGNRSYSAHEEITKGQVVPTLAPPRFRPNNKASEVAPKGRPPGLLPNPVQVQKQIAHSRSRT